MPILRTLEYMGPLPILRTIQTSNLTHILLEGGTLGGAIDIISRCPAAQMVIINTRVKRTDEFPRPFTLGDLTYLSIPSVFAMAFQNVLKAPKLDELCLTWDGLGHDFTQMQVLPVHSLRKVTLEDIILSLWLKPLCDFMVQHPMIEQLTLNGCGDPIIVPAILTPKDERDTAYSVLLQDIELPGDLGPPLPSLKMLCFRCTTRGLGGNGFLGACIVDLLDARPTLSFSATESSFSKSEVKLSEIEERFGGRVSRAQEPETGPVWSQRGFNSSC